MGMDVYGRNPKINKKIEDFPVYHKYKDMDLKEKWKKLDKDEELQGQYHKEWDDLRKQIQEFILGITVGGGDHYGIIVIILKAISIQ